MENRCIQFLKKFTRSNYGIIKAAQFNILHNINDDPYIVTQILEKLSNSIYEWCVLMDNNFEPFVYDVFDNNDNKLYNTCTQIYSTNVDAVIKKVSFEIMYLITHGDFNIDTCTIINDNTYLDTNLNTLQLFFELNK